MEIKLIIFDLDGVLIDSRPLHYEALNMALKNIDEKYIISLDEHITKYDGIPTKQKLNLLSREKGLPIGSHNHVWESKQIMTTKLIEERVTRDEHLISLLRRLKEDKYIIYCASNSIYNTLKLILAKKGIIEFFDYFISNEELKNPKPSPEIYFKCLERANCSVHETLICEDSPIGRKAVLDSGCHLCPINNTSDLTLDKIYKYVKLCEEKNSKFLVEYNEHLKWNGDINVIIPMAGYGSRFQKAGYTIPKPLIPINGTPMIELVVNNIGIRGQYIFIVREEHYDKYNLKELLERIAPGCHIIKETSQLQGAATSVLLAKEYINNNSPLLIANSDQYLEWNPSEFLYCSNSEGIDGCISTFYNTDNKWSYAKLDNKGYVTEVKEKQVISTTATTGIYFWKHGADFVKYAEQMINKNIRVNGEFYVCPVFNEAINDGKKIKIKECNKMWGLGVPEDVDCFLQNFKQNK